MVAAGLLLSAAARLRRRVRRTAWVLTRVAAAIGEAERAGRSGRSWPTRREGLPWGVEHPPGGTQAVPAGDDRRRADGRKELVALADGYRESVESWADLLRDGKRRGMRARSSRSVTARSGSGARCARCSPKRTEQRCWFHKIGNVLAALPKSAHPGAKKALAEIWNARTATTPAAPSRRRGVQTGLRRQVSAKPSRRCGRQVVTLPCRRSGRSAVVRRR